jgi:predicted HTH domain antitoxin
MPLVISDDILEKTHLSGNEILIELAVYLYSQKRLSSGQARKLAGLDVISFQKELAKRNVDINYDVEELKKDIETLKALP